MTRLRSIVTLGSALVVAASAVMACSDDAPAPDRNLSDGTETPNQDAAIAPSGGSVRAPYQVRTSAEIASTLESCFGTGVTTVSASMIQTADNPAGFLAARQFSEGADVVSGESSIIDGDPSVERTGVRNSSLSLPILAALQDIGNVVGENCVAQPDNALCQCATQEDAHAMLSRCLPSVAPAKYSALEATFADTCAKDQAGAIASLLASTAFGVQ
jgi:hypothetical protein